VGFVTLVDLDDICVTNSNRQIHATSQTVGRSKVHVMRKRMLEISPYMRVDCIDDFFTPKTTDLILNRAYHCLVDAIDQQNRKVDLIAECIRRHIPLVVSGGAGGRQNPHGVTSADLSQTTHDGLLRNVKRSLRNDSAYSDLRVLFKSQDWGVPAVFSTERPVYPTETGEVCHTMSTKEVVRLDCQLGFGASAFVTGTFGFHLSGLVINLIKDQMISNTKDDAQ
jgi:tRNA A37 threonylcarbamoyladenosine dehydratase